MNRYQLTQCIEEGCKNIWAKIKLQRHNDSVVILRHKTTFFVLKTSFNSSTSFGGIGSKCVIAAENFILPPQKELEIPVVKDFSEEGGGALKKNPFHGKMCIFSGTTQWIYLLLKEAGGGGVRFEMQERLESSCLI